MCWQMLVFPLRLRSLPIGRRANDSGWTRIKGSLIASALALQQTAQASDLSGPSLNSPLGLHRAVI